MVHVRGLVTAGQGLVGDDELFTLADDSGAIFVRPSTALDRLEPGRQVELVGSLAAPYGQLEVRSLARLVQGPLGDPPSPTRVELGEIGESTEGSLVTFNGSVESVASESGHLSLTVGDGTTSVRVFADPLSGISRSDVSAGNVVVVSGIVGQRSSATGRLDGYRLWLRSSLDLAVCEPFEPEPTDEAPAPEPTSSPSASPSLSPGPAAHLGSALGTKGASVDVVAVVTATAGLFEVDGPTIVVDDGTAAAAVVLPEGAPAPSVGAEVRVAGKVGRWETGPIVRASAIQLLGGSQSPQAAQIGAAPAAALEWRLVRVYGRVDKVTRAGVRWRLEVSVNGHSAVVLGEPAAGPLPGETSGRMITVTGIVRRSTSDSASFQILPRGAGDVRWGPMLATKSLASPDSSVAPDVLAAATDGASSSARVPLSDAGSYLGVRITVAGLVTEVAAGEAVIEDGTGRLRIGGTAAAEEIGLLEPGDAAEVVGIVSEDSGGLLLVADPGSVLVLPGQLGDASPAASESLAWNSAVLAVSAAPDADVDAGAAQRARSTDRPADLATLLAVIALAALAVVAGIVVGRPLWRRSTPAERRDEAVPGGD